MRNRFSAVLLAALLAPALSASAAGLAITVEIPRLNVAEYHRPYVAIWLEDAAHKHVADLAVWYDLKLKDDEGEKWLKDLRQWWRRSGRTLDLPIDGLSGPTRPVGSHTLTLDSSHAVLRALAAGDYQLVVEAAREVGGRELLRLPFSWPASSASTTSTAGEAELGTITLTITP
ncbi:MAG: DUF2271 domain-containing protein [Spongiibacteraceae bacterium]|jgi:hypothetical protein|nr:DUF2271 domain-containing protein [Spongiibacteraceae bacterium]